MQFAKVPSKDAIIKNMIRNPELFLKAQNIYDKQDWPALAALIEKFKVLKGSPVVVEYEDLIKKEEDRFLSLMSSGRFEEAEEPANFIRENAKIDQVSLKIEFQRLSVVEQFRDIIAAKQYSVAMQMAIDNPFLISSKPYKELDQMLSLRFKTAHAYAIKNHFEAVDKMLRPFLRNPFTSNRAIGIYKTLYIEQINMLASKMQRQHWLNTLKNYITRFGIDNEIELVTRKYDQEKLLEPFREFQNPNFLRYPLIANIVTTPFAKPSAPA
jgi:hypothetical protein